MKIFITDESNLSRESRLEFFAYGGIIVDGSESRLMTQELERIKLEANIPLERPLKWNNTKWNREPPIDSAKHALLKDKILEIFSASNSKIIVYLAPQDFYHTIGIVRRVFKFSIDPERQKQAMEWAMNVCLHKYDRLLTQSDDYGVVIADAFGSSDLRQHMREHCFGLFPNGGHFSKFERISYPTIFIDDEYSELHQINDVVLGAVQFSLKEMAHNLLPRLRDNFWCSDPTNSTTILGKGFDVYPKKEGMYSKKIKTLKDKFLRLVSV